MLFISNIGIYSNLLHMLDIQYMSGKQHSLNHKTSNKVSLFILFQKHSYFFLVHVSRTLISKS